MDHSTSRWQIGYMGLIFLFCFSCVIYHKSLWCMVPVLLVRHWQWVRGAKILIRSFPIITFVVRQLSSGCNEKTKLFTILPYYLPTTIDRLSPTTEWRRQQQHRWTRQRQHPWDNNDPRHPPSEFLVRRKPPFRGRARRWWWRWCSW